MLRVNSWHHFAAVNVWTFWADRVDIRILHYDLFSYLHSHVWCSTKVISTYSWSGSDGLIFNSWGKKQVEIIDAITVYIAMNHTNLKLGLVIYFRSIFFVSVAVAASLPFCTLNMPCVHCTQLEFSWIQRYFLLFSPLVWWRVCSQKLILVMTMLFFFFLRQNEKLGCG